MPPRDRIKAKSAGSLVIDDSVQQPQSADAGEIQKGTAGRGRDRKCRKLSRRLSQIVVTFFSPSPSRRPLFCFRRRWGGRAQSRSRRQEIAREGPIGEGVVPVSFGQCGSVQLRARGIIWCQWGSDVDIKHTGGASGRNGHQVSSLRARGGGDNLFSSHMPTSRAHTRAHTHTHISPKMQEPSTY